jgi:surfeit locus 1 family protein
LTGWKLRLFVAFAILAAALFVRLGIWQLHRLDERRARNRLISERIEAAPVDVSALPRDTAVTHYRRVRVLGQRDYDHELVYAARTHDGAPGVDLLTPVRIPGSDTAVLVNRGWVYSADGATVDLANLRDRDSTFEGYVEEFPAGAGAAFSTNARTIARLSYSVAAKAIPYPIAPFYVVLAADKGVPADSANKARQPTRIGAPVLDEGPHKSYAFQWFCFAAIALIGAGVVVKQSRSGELRPMSDVDGAAADARGPRLR